MWVEVEVGVSGGGDMFKGNFGKLLFLCYT